MEKLFIQQCKFEHIPLLQSFSIPYEHYCVELCSHLRKNPSQLYIISITEKIENPFQIKGFFLLNKSLIVCLPFWKEDPEQYKLLISPLIIANNSCSIKLLMGEESSIEFILSFLKDIHSPKYINTYDVMLLSSPPNLPPEKLSEDDQIICCTKNDFSSLFDLQKNYIIKEVALPNQKITDNDCNLMLSDILKNQLVMAVSCDAEDGKFVSKVNTNAIGFNWIQLGGIFTHPLYRHNYYAWTLIQTISQRIQKSGKKVCLFVKTRNNPALSLYEKIGFKKSETLNIIYF